MLGSDPDEGAAEVSRAELGDVTWPYEDRSEVVEEHLLLVTHYQVSITEGVPFQPTLVSTMVLLRGDPAPGGDRVTTAALYFHSGPRPASYYEEPEGGGEGRINLFLDPSDVGTVLAILRSPSEVTCRWQKRASSYVRGSLGACKMPVGPG